ncbi:MAG: hypothetical protein U5N10_19395 [Gemmobacter sp.]|nr:hypothetical protein [Gemmobacter sp.]
MLLAMQAARLHRLATVYKAKVMDVANAPGEPILPGELGKALDLIAAGTDIDYIGANVGRTDRRGRKRRQLPRDTKSRTASLETVKFR